MKVKVTTKQPIEALRGKLVHEADLFCTSRNWSFKQRKQFKKRLTEIADHTLAALKENISVNGKDWNAPESNEQPTEPFNPKLQVDLTAFIVKVNDTIVNVTSMRKTAPEKISTNVETSFDVARKRDGLEMTSHGTEPIEASIFASEPSPTLKNVIKDFQGSVTMLSKLGKMFPDLVNKTNKVVKVSEEEQQQKLQPENSSIYKLLKNDAKTVLAPLAISN